MTEGDVNDHLAFKKTMWPNSSLDPECLNTDIFRNIRDGIAYAVFQGEKMISNASAPHIAHMQTMIEEPGAETLPGFRKQGFGKAVLSHTTRAILDLNRVPIYRLSKTNVASLRTAECVGYRLIAESVLFRTRK